MSIHSRFEKVQGTNLQTVNSTGLVKQAGISSLIYLQQFTLTLLPRI